MLPILFAMHLRLKTKRWHWCYRAKLFKGGTGASIELVFNGGTGANSKGGTSDSFNDDTDDVSRVALVMLPKLF